MTIFFNVDFFEIITLPFILKKIKNTIRFPAAEYDNGRAARRDVRVGGGGVGPINRSSPSSLVTSQSSSFCPPVFNLISISAKGFIIVRRTFERQNVLIVIIEQGAG